jgi:hypothetical protein
MEGAFALNSSVKVPGTFSLPNYTAKHPEGQMIDTRHLFWYNTNTPKEPLMRLFWGYE